MFWNTGELGTAVTQWRRRNNLTQADMAHQVGISRNYLSLIERGVADNISLGVYRTVCELIGMPDARPDNLNALFVEMYTAYAELAGAAGCDSCLNSLDDWRFRYMRITGHYLRP